LRCAGARLPSGGETAVSIRQHDIRLMPKAPEATENSFRHVMRQVFLGAARLYSAGRRWNQLRVVTSAQDNIAQRSPVWLHLPPERCAR